MTKADISKMLREAWTAALMDTNDFREDLADNYAAWVQGLIKAAAPELTGQKQGGGQEQQQGGQEGAPPMEGGGAMMPPAPEGGMQ